jgi:hypothetical protein
VKYAVHTKAIQISSGEALWPISEYIPEPWDCWWEVAYAKNKAMAEKIVRALEQADVSAEVSGT